MALAFDASANGTRRKHILDTEYGEKHVAVSTRKIFSAARLLPCSSVKVHVGCVPRPTNMNTNTLAQVQKIATIKRKYSRKKLNA